MSTGTKYVCFLQESALSRDEVRAQLTAMGCSYELIWLNDPDSENHFDKVEIVVTFEHKVGPDELDRFNGVKMLSLGFTGYDEVDRAYCKERGLHVYFVPGYSTDSVAELAATMAGCLYRKLPIIHRRIRSGNWDRIPVASDERTPVTAPGRELRGSVVGIIGTGEIGMRTAELFHRGYGCRLIGWAHSNRRREFLNLGGAYRDIDDVFADADIVSLHVKLNDETRHIANQRRLELMNEDSILLNTARTNLVDIEALVRVLRRRSGMGAGLDLTYESELTEDLLSLENVVLTPHIGFKTHRALRDLATLTIGNIGDYLFPKNTRRLLPNGD